MSAVSISASFSGDLDLLLSNVSASFKSPVFPSSSLGDLERDLCSGDRDRRSTDFERFSGVLDLLSLDLERDLLSSGLLERLSRDLER